MAPKKYPTVMVTWQDAHHVIDWRHVDAIARADTNTATVRSVGFLVKKTKTEIVLAHGICADGDVESTFAIPRDWCQRIKRIK